MKVNKGKRNKCVLRRKVEDEGLRGNGRKELEKRG